MGGVGSREANEMVEKKTGSDIDIPGGMDLNDPGAGAFGRGTFSVDEWVGSRGQRNGPHPRIDCGIPGLEVPASAFLSRMAGGLFPVPTIAKPQVANPARKAE
jgi:hypothetical protein